MKLSPLFTIQNMIASLDLDFSKQLNIDYVCILVAKTEDFHC